MRWKVLVSLYPAERRSRPSIEHGTRRLGQGVILAEIVVPKPCAVVEPLKVHREGENIRHIVVVELGRLKGPQLRTNAARIRAFGDGADVVAVAALPSRAAVGRVPHAYTLCVALIVDVVFVLEPRGLH